MSDTTRKIPHVPADNITALVEKLGASSAAQRLGVAPSTVYSAQSKGKVRLTLDLAARYWLDRITPSATTTKPSELVVLKVPAEKMLLVTTFLKGAEVKYRRFVDDATSGGEG